MTSRGNERRDIVLNPVRYRGGAVRRRLPLEQLPFYSRAGSSAAMVRYRLETGWTLDQFHPGDRAAAHEIYRRFVAEGRGAAYKPWEKLVGQMFLGGTGFCDRMQELVRRESRSREHPRQQREFVRPSFDAIVENVESVFATTAEQLRSKSRGQARKALAQLVLDDGGLTLRLVAEWMGVSDWAVSKMRRSARELYDTNAEYRRCIGQIRRALS